VDYPAEKGGDAAPAAPAPPPVASEPAASAR